MMQTTIWIGVYRETPRYGGDLHLDPSTARDTKKECLQEMQVQLNQRRELGLIDEPHCGIVRLVVTAQETQVIDVIDFDGTLKVAKE